MSKQNVTIWATEDLFSGGLDGALLRNHFRACARDGAQQVVISPRSKADLAATLAKTGLDGRTLHMLDGDTAAAMKKTDLAAQVCEALGGLNQKRVIAKQGIAQPQHCTVIAASPAEAATLQAATGMRCTDAPLLVRTLSMNT